MRLLIFHNILWSHYKSVIFEKLQNELLSKDIKSELLVIQTSITENSRKDLVNFNLNTFPYSYKYKLISENLPLEKVSKLNILITRIYYIYKFKPDTINFTGYNEFGTLLLFLICRILKIKIIVTNESINTNSSKTLLNEFKYYYKTLLFKLANGFFSYGLNSNLYLFKHKVPKSKIYSFLNTFDRAKFISNDKIKRLEYPYLLFVGRLSEEKNLTELIRLFSEIRKNINNLKLVLIGNGPEKEQLMTLSKALKLNNDITFLGSVKWEELADYYRHSECLLLTSKSETWGMVANEAQEMGIPVISTANCGCSNDLIIDNYSGIVVDNITSAKNRNKIIHFISTKNKTKLISFIQNNNKIFSLNRLCKEMLDVL
ncbi:glycosyltransferase [Aquirufa sp. ROCK-SH2]